MQSYEKKFTKTHIRAYLRIFSLEFGIFSRYFFLICQKCCYFALDLLITHKKKMKVFNKIVDLQNQLFEDRKKGKEIGLVPTMGALHEGHASLVKRSVKENGVTVVSVFVNPTQFNDKNDLKNYPRTLEADCELLEKCGADYVLAPSVEEMYPTPDTRGCTSSRAFQWCLSGR